MSGDTGRTKPNVLQYIRYCYGARLPDSMLDWAPYVTGASAAGVSVSYLTVPITVPVMAW